MKRSLFRCRVVLVKLFFFFTVVFSALTINAETLRFSTLNSSDGLPQDSIRDIVQDLNGLMWFATEDGIARYDGREMKVYRYNPDDPHPIPDNVIQQFLPDSANRLWVTIQGEAGVAVLDQATQEFHELENKQVDDFKIGNTASAILQRASADVVFGSVNGVFSVSPENLAIKKKLIDQGQLQHEAVVTGLWEGPKSRLWVASADGKTGYLSEAGQFTSIDSKIDHIIGVKKISGIGDVLVAGNDGLFLIDYEKIAFKPLFKETFLENRNVRDIVQAPDGELWIATRDGLIRYNISSDVAHIAEKNPSDENGLPTNELTTLYISDDEILWIGTTDKGVVSLNLRHYGFTSYSSRNLKQIHPRNTEGVEADGLKSDMIWSIFRDSQNTLWIGHTDGVSSQEEGQDSFANLSKIGSGGKSFDVSRSWIMTIHETEDYLWFGTWGEGLVRYNPKTDETLLYSTDSPVVGEVLSGNVIRLLLWDKQRDSLWVGTHRNGLNQINLTTGKIIQYLPDPADGHSFPHPRSRALYLDNDNRLWVGSGGGLAVFNDIEKNFSLVDKFPENETFSDVRGIYQSNDNTLWAANGYGLDKVNIDDLAVEKRFLEKDGLSRSALYGIVPDEAGDLWIPTIKGLTRFNPAEGDFTRYFVGHNLQSNEFNFNAMWREGDGSIIMGGTGGITKFHPNEVNQEIHAKDPVILSVSALNNRFNEERVVGVAGNSTENAFFLEPEQRSLLIDFTIPEYSFQSDIRYQYKLEGNDREWIVAESRDVPVRYTNLSPGNYAFQVRSVEGGSESSRMLSIGFSATPFIWERLWFQCVFAILILILTSIFLRKLYQAYNERSVSRERSNLYNMVIHELGPSLRRSQESLSRLSHFAKVPENQITAIQSESSYALAFVDQLRALSTIEGYKEQRKKLYLLEDIWDDSLLGITVENHRIKLDHMPDVSIRAYENSVQFVIRNLLSNAIKYSEGDTPIHAAFEIVNKDLLIRVSDFGFGIDDELKEKVLNPYERGDIYKAEGLGLGLNLIKKIAEKYGGTVTVSDNEPNGSIIIVRLRNVVVLE